MLASVLRSLQDRGGGYAWKILDNCMKSVACVDVLIKQRHGDKTSKLRVASVYLQSAWGDPEGLAAQDGYDALERACVAAKADKCLFVCGGDFNADPGCNMDGDPWQLGMRGTTPRERVAKRDARGHQFVRFVESTKLVVATRQMRGCESTFVTKQGVKRQLDHILLSPLLVPRKCGTVVTLAPLSDHAPVMCGFELPKKRRFTHKVDKGRTRMT